MTTPVHVGTAAIVPGQPIYFVAEIGINHNGDLALAKQLIDVAVDAGCNAVKFQKRTPKLCVPKDQWDRVRETPWGTMSYIDYKERIEFVEEEFAAIDTHCKEAGIDWFASPWDEPSVDFLEQFNTVAHKVASASLTDDALLQKLMATKKPLFVSTGMSTDDEINAAMDTLQGAPVILAHCTSTYPCPPEQVNLRMMDTLAARFDFPVGYSGHEKGLQVSLAAAARGATWIERHITLDRTMWGTDHAVSLEPGGLQRLLRDIRIIETALGTGEKAVYPEEEGFRAKLRRR